MPHKLENIRSSTRRHLLAEDLLMVRAFSAVEPLSAAASVGRPSLNLPCACIVDEEKIGIPSYVDSAKPLEWLASAHLLFNLLASKQTPESIESAGSNQIIGSKQ